MKTLFLCALMAAIIGLAPLSGVSLYEKEYVPTADIAGVGDDDWSDLDLAYFDDYR